MEKIKVIISLSVRADREDDDAVREAIYDALQEDMEMEDLRYVVEEDDTDEEED